jgi:hypothetical protein
MVNPGAITRTYIAAQLPDRTALEEEATKPNTDIAVVAAVIATLSVAFIFGARSLTRWWHRRQHKRHRRRRRAQPSASALLPPKDADGPRAPAEDNV